MPEPHREPPRPAPCEVPCAQTPEPCAQESPCPAAPTCSRGCQPRPHPRRVKKPANGGSVGGFFRQLLPRDFETEDLLVVILLLLMAGDCQEDQNSALLTLALYLFL